MAIGPQVPPSSSAVILQPDNATLATTFYNAARAEIIQRLSMRETTFLAWITVVGAILSFAAKNSSGGILFEPRHLQLIPPLCFPFSLAIYRHSLIINYLGEYLRDDLGVHLRQGAIPAERDKQHAPRHWDNSRTLSTRIRWFLALEGTAYTFFLAGVPVFCLLYLHRAAHLSWCGPWLLVGLAFTAITALVGVIQVARALAGS